MCAIIDKKSTKNFHKRHKGKKIVAYKIIDNENKSPLQLYTFQKGDK